MRFDDQCGGGQDQLEGCIITVAPGTYIDNVSLDLGTKAKPLRLLISGTSTASTIIIDGNGTAPVFAFGGNVKIHLADLTITDGAGRQISPGTAGGGIFAIGGILEVSSCIVENNQANLGAGIYSDNVDLEVVNSLIADNGSSVQSVRNIGGGILFESDKGHTVKIVSSTIAGNAAAFAGGGVMINGKLPKRPKAEIIDSTISGNVTNNPFSGGEGGAGLELIAAKLTMLDSTLSGNTAGGNTAAGGGIQVALTDAVLNNVTISDNSASTAGGIDATEINISGSDSLKRLVISNAIVADNLAPSNADCLAGGVTPPIISADYNLIGDANGCALSGRMGHNLGGEPLLGPLQNNGGATDTMALLTGSPALGAGNPARPNKNGQHGPCLANDQIGTPRAKSDCDIGAWQHPE